MTEPKITVCIPTYNRANLLPGAVKSVTSQQFRDCEILISDDGSSDATPHIAEALCRSDPRIRYVGGKIHLGFTANLQRSLLSARGSGIVLLADDDFLLPGALGAYARVFNTMPNVGVITCNMFQIDASGRQCTYVMRYFRESRAFKRGQQAFEGIWPLTTFMSGLGIRRSEYLQSCSTYKNYPQLLMVGRLLMDFDGFGLSDFCIAARVHPGQFGGKMLTIFERETGKHAFVEMPMILNQLGEERGADAQLDARRILEPFMMNAYHVFIMNRNLEGGSHLALRTTRTAFETYPALKTNPMFVGIALVSSIVPKRILLFVKERIRAFQLNVLHKVEYEAFRDGIEPRLIDYAG